MDLLDINDLKDKIKKAGAKWEANFDPDSNPIHRLDKQARKRLAGAVKPAGYQTPARVTKKAVDTSTLPSKIDWRDNNGDFVTPVKFQGLCPICSAFGTSAVMEARIAIEHQQLVELSEADEFFCSAHGPNCTEASWPLNLLQENKERGICQEILFPYPSAYSVADLSEEFPEDLSNPKNMIEATKIAPKCIISPMRDDNAFKYSEIITITDLDATKEYLAKIGPISAVMKLYDDILEYQSGIYTHVHGESSGNHVICIVGYNDADGGYYICKNSWSEHWGMDGYFNIAYGECNIDENEKVGVKGITLPKIILNYYKCLGTDVNAKYLYLDGIAKNGSVNLCADTNAYSNPGTYWEEQQLSDGSVALKCMGTTEKSDFVYLDGNTQDGSVGLAANTDSDNSGTHWQKEQLSDGSTAFKCLNTTGNSDFVYLDGHTKDGTVGLAPNTDSSYSGTHWEKNGFTSS
ncbi:MAG: C1 family peptidase [Leptospirales bacterium]